MNELALFAGAGGGILGGRLLGWRTVCAVEINRHRRDCLLARQNDGLLEPFPVWDDIRTFDGLQWRGRVDVVSGGFPCQAYSTAARGRNSADDLWPEMRRIVAEIAPRYVFAENVSRRAIDAACDDLEQMVWTKNSISDPYCVHCGKTWDMHLADGRSSCPKGAENELFIEAGENAHDRFMNHDTPWEGTSLGTASRMSSCPICKQADCRLTYEECHRVSANENEAQ